MRDTHEARGRDRLPVEAEQAVPPGPLERDRAADRSRRRERPAGREGAAPADGQGGGGAGRPVRRGQDHAARSRTSPATASRSRSSSSACRASRSCSCCSRSSSAPSMSMHDERDWGTLVAAPRRARRLHAASCSASWRRASSSASCRCSCCSPGATGCSASRSARRRWRSAAHDGVGLRGRRRGHAGRGPRPLARADAAARAVDRDGALGARRLLVAAVDAARLDEPRLAGVLHAPGRCAG